MGRAPRTGLFTGKSDITAFFFIFFAAVIAFGIGIYSSLDDRGGASSQHGLSGDSGSGRSGTAVNGDVSRGSVQQGKAVKKNASGRKDKRQSKNNTAERVVINRESEKKPVNDVPTPDEVQEPEKTAVTPEKREEKTQPARTDVPEKKEEKNIPDVKREGSGKVAIIIDDFGNNLRNVDEFCNMGIPITFAVLPYLKYSKQISNQAVGAGQAVILHLPMENQRGINPGPGTLKIDMKRDELLKEFRMDLSFVPGAEGLNNHEGSLATENEEVMTQILSQAKDKGLFFIDSMTSSKSLGLRISGELGVPALRRNVFLDNEDDVDYISGQLDQLADVAFRDGYAVGIGHVRANTFKAISQKYPEMQKRGIEFVFVRDLVR